MLYNDRKMAKWRGFFLSEHLTELAKVEKEEQCVRVIKEQQSEEEISKMLDFSYHKKRIIEIQMNFIEKGEYVEEVKGIVEGVAGNSIYFVKENYDLIVIDISLIRSATEIEAVKWFNQ